MSVNRRSIPTPDEAMPKAAQTIDEPVLAVWDGSQCGPRSIKTIHGEKDGFAVRVITRKNDIGRVMYFWTAVVAQLSAALKQSGDGAFFTIHKEGRNYVATQITDEETMSELERVYNESRPSDADAPAEPSDEAEFDTSDAE